MKIALMAALSAAVLSGCAGQQIKFDEVPRTTYLLPYSNVLVEDFTQDRKVSISDVTWVNGWVPLFDGTMGPSPNKTFYSYLSKALTSSPGSEDTLKVTLIDSSFLMEQNFSDNVAFINMITAQRERGFKCTASISMSNKSKTEREEFEVVERAVASMAYFQAFVTRCRENLTGEIGAYLKKF